MRDLLSMESVCRPNEANHYEDYRKIEPIEKGIELAARIGHSLTGVIKGNVPEVGREDCLTYYISDGNRAYEGTLKQVLNKIDNSKKSGFMWALYKGSKYKGWIVRKVDRDE